MPEEKIEITEKSFELFEVYDIINTIQQSEKPEIEKIPILIKHAKQFYDRLDLNFKETKRQGWVFDEDSKVWKKQIMDIEDIIKSSRKAYDNYEVEKALQNLEIAFDFYKGRYNKFLSVYKPFYNYVFKLLEDVNKSLEHVKKLKEERRVEIDKDKLIKDQENKLDTLLEKNKDAKALVEETNKKMDENLGNIVQYNQWIRVLTDNGMFSKTDEIRIVLFLLLHGETQNSIIATKLRIPTSATTRNLQNLYNRGVLNVREIMKTKRYYTDYVFVERYLADMQKGDVARTETLVDKVAEHKAQKEIEENLNENKEELPPGKEDDK